jgi:hypothetical protein
MTTAMQPACVSSIAADVGAFIDVIGERHWTSRIQALTKAAAGPQRAGRALLQRHAAEIILERLRREDLDRTGAAGRALLGLARHATRVHAGLSHAGRGRMRAALQAGLEGNNTLVPVLHVVDTAARQHARGFAVYFAAWQDAAPFDLLIHRDGTEAEIACDVVSAEEGRNVRRGAWVDLVDGIDPDLQTWLAAHPGRYVLKLTLPQGLRGEADAQGCNLADLHGRIRAMLQASRRADHDEAAVLRLDPLMLAAAQADELGLMSSLRREFGREAHLAVTTAGGGVFVLAARAGREDEVAGAIRRRMAEIAPLRLTGTRPGILAMFVEDTDHAEWRDLRDRLALEGETRQFLTDAAARSVVAVTCVSRMELLGAGVEGELRFRSPSHPAGGLEALAPAVAPA